MQVAAFPLLKPYTAALFARVEQELSPRMRQIAQQTGGTVSGRDHRHRRRDPGPLVRGEGRRRVDEYTFVLRGMREFQLLCRRQASSSDDACKQLLTSFTVP